MKYMWPFIIGSVVLIFAIIAGISMIKLPSEDVAPTMYIKDVSVGLSDDTLKVTGVHEPLYILRMSSNDSCVTLSDNLNNIVHVRIDTFGVTGVDITTSLLRPIPVAVHP